MRDAVMLKKELIASLPPDRQQELRKLITYSFSIETPDDDADDDANDSRVEFSTANAKLMWSQSMWSRKWKKRFQRDSDAAPTETTSLV
jgi:hypothetical protein